MTLQAIEQKKEKYLKIMIWIGIWIIAGCIVLKWAIDFMNDDNF